MQNTGEKRKSKSKIFAKAVICICVSACVLLISFGEQTGLPEWHDIFAYCGVYAEENEGLFAGFVNVGSADACCIKCGDKQLLIDSGTERTCHKLSSFLERYDFTHFDYAIISHPDTDHFGGMTEVIEKFGVDTIYITSLPKELEPDNAEYRRFLDSVKENNVKLICQSSDKKLTLGEMELDFISPKKEYDNRNDNSLAVKISYGNHKFLFTGDISEKAEQDLLDSDIDLNCDVLKVAHHGSKSSSCKAFLKAVSPEISVVSVGSSDVALPDYSTMARIDKYSSSVYRTDSDYSVVITSDGVNLKVHTDS